MAAPGYSTGGGGGGSTAPKKKKSSGGASSGGARTTQRRTTSTRSTSTAVDKNPLVPGVKYFGQELRRSQYLQLKQHYNDIFRAWLGRPVREAELKRLLNRGVSDFALRKQLINKKGFRKSPMFRTLTRQTEDILGFRYTPPSSVFKEAFASEGGLSADSLRAALARNQKVRKRVTTDFRATGQAADAQYLAGSYGQGALNNQDVQKLALQRSGLRTTTFGRRLEESLQKALERSQRAFQSTLATPQFGLGQAGLQAQSLQPQQEEDLPA